MRSKIILAGAAALVIASPVLAQGKGNGGNKGGGGPAKAEHGGGGGPAKADRGGGRPEKAERGHGGGGQQAHRGGGQQRAERQEMRGPDRRPARSEQRAQRPDRDQPQRGRDRKEQQREVREVRDVRQSRDVRGNGRAGDVRGSERMVQGGQDRQDRQRTILASGSNDQGFRFACPPGLAAKNNGCLPPGQAKRLVGAVVPATLTSAFLPPLYRSWYPDDDGYYYREDEGYVYRIDRDQNLVDGFFPLYDDDWNGAYYVGASYPQDYLGTYNVPVQYRPWYEDGDDYYRYGDGAIYQVDRQGGLIEAIVSLLAGDLAPGQPLPDGYDVYNVPYDYRDRYADSDDAWYRYNDGQIYQVDPTTRLVQAVVETLT
jgi:hypothetical protein